MIYMGTPNVRNYLTAKLKELTARLAAVGETLILQLFRGGGGGGGGGLVAGMSSRFFFLASGSDSLCFLAVFYVHSSSLQFQPFTCTRLVQH